MKAKSKGISVSLCFCFFLITFLYFFPLLILFLWGCILALFLSCLAVRPRVVVREVKIVARVLTNMYNKIKMGGLKWRQGDVRKTG